MGKVQVQIFRQDLILDSDREVRPAFFGCNCKKFSVILVTLTGVVIAKIVLFYFFIQDFPKM